MIFWRFKKTLLVALLLAASFAGPTQVDAHDIHKTPIASSYNNQIISDYEFRAKSTMTEAQIQAFLVSKGSALANYTIPTNGSVRTDIGWYNAVESKGWKASKVIYYSAQWYSINPQALLATLQKESSLVTSGTLSYINSAMGYDCPESSSCNPAYAGFARQMDGAAYQFYYNFKYSELNDSSRVGIYRKGNTATIDGKATYIANSATAALYRYTPHRPDSAWLTATNGSHYYGNYNFIYFYSSWFNYGDFLQSNLEIVAFTFSAGTPARGETVNVSLSIKNNVGSAVTLAKVGVIGRLGSSSSGLNRDLPGVEAVSFATGETKNFNFSTTIKDIGSLYYWPYFKYGGIFYQYENKTKKLATHEPEIIVTQSLALSNPSTPMIGATPSVSITVRNNEDANIKLDDLMIAARYNDVWNRDTARVGAITLPAGGSEVLSGSIAFNKPGSYVLWPAYKQNGLWYATGSVKKYTIATVTKDTFPMSLKVNSRRYPAIGERSLATVTITNPHSYNVTLQSVGVAARAASPLSSYYRNYGSSQDVTIQAGGSWSQTFETRIKDLGNIYLWPYFKFGNQFYSEDIWANKLITHAPKLTVSTPIVVTNAIKGQVGAITATVRNDEPYSLYLDEIGFKVRYSSVYNRDTGFVLGTILSKATKSLNGTIDFNKSGTYSAWVAYKQNGNLGVISSSFWSKVIN